MTSGNAFAISRRDAPGVLHQPCPLENRGRREDRVRAAPAVSCACLHKDRLHMSIQVWRRHPAFPAQWLYGLYVIVLVTLLFVTPSPCEAFASSRVDACIGASDPNDFAVRTSNARQSLPCVHRISPHVVTIASAPLIAGDGRRYAFDLPDGATEIFLAEGLDILLVICPSG